jgi:predicted nucleic acid-binding protein
VIIVDTSAWIPFFNRPESTEKQAIDALIDADRAVLVGVVLAELLQGCRTPKEASVVLDEIAGLRFLEVAFSTWQRTGELSASLKRAGIILPLSDVLIAAIVLEHSCQVYSLDPHFAQIPGLPGFPRRRIELRMGRLGWPKMRCEPQREPVPPGDGHGPVQET